MKSTNYYNSFINTPFSDLFRPATEHIDSAKTENHRPDKNIVEKTGCNSLAEVLEKRLGNKDYNTYKGKMTDYLSIKSRMEKFYYSCYDDDYKEIVLTAYAIMKFTFSDILEDLAELSTIALRTMPDEVPFLHTKVDDLDKEDIASAFVIMENCFGLDKDEILKKFPEMTIGDVLSASHDSFIKYNNAEDKKEILFWGNVAYEAKFLMTSIFITPWARENTNLL